MRIVLITPARPSARAGNRQTAVRWARMLRASGHRVDIAVDYAGGNHEAMIALHAWRSADAIRRFRERYPDRPLIVALTGTDIYRFQYSDPGVTHESMALADRLIVLHEAAHADIPAEHRAKTRVVLQSAEPLPRRYPRERRHFTACVVGHLREEKDPLRAAYAVRDLPQTSRVRVVHLGAAHNEDWAAHAREEMAHNPRYEWRGEVAHWRVRQRMGRSHLMVLSSRMEGGANVISEACVAGLPVIASRISGSTGLLGPDYPGYYPVEDTSALTTVLLRAEREPDFYRALEDACAERAPAFRPEREAASLRGVVTEL